MAYPIESTPVVFDEDAERLLKKVEYNNKHTRILEKPDLSRLRELLFLRKLQKIQDFEKRIEKAWEIHKNTLEKLS